jgi:hypothetical protein
VPILPPCMRRGGAPYRNAASVSLELVPTGSGDPPGTPLALSCSWLAQPPLSRSAHMTGWTADRARTRCGKACPAATSGRLC